MEAEKIDFEQQMKLLEAKNRLIATLSNEIWSSIAWKTNESLMNNVSP